MTRINTVEKWSGQSPYNKEEECAKFTIDDVEQQFSLTDIVVVGEQYTLSFWIKSDSDGTIVAAGSTVNSSTAWTKHSTTFVASDVDVSIRFQVVGTYYIYHSMLEIGNTATDWSPAPEDVDQSIVDQSDEIREVMSEQTASTLDACDEKMETALESYVDLSEYGEFKESVAAQMAILENEIEMTFPVLSDRIDTVDADLQSKYGSVHKHITFSEDGITIYASDENAMSIRIDNDVIRFEKNGIAFGWWDGINFNTGNITVNLNERAQFGNFAYVPRSDGSLSFLKVANFANVYATLNYGIMMLYGAQAALEDATLNITGVTGELSETTLTIGG